MALVFQPVHGEGEGHLPMFVVVAVGLAVGGDVGELGAVVRAGGLGLETREEALAKLFAGVEEAFKGDGSGVRTVVEEDGDGTAFVKGDPVRLGRVDGVVRCLGPVGGVVRLVRADAGALVGGEDGVKDSLLGEEVENLAVDGGLGEPHAFGLAAETVFEVGDAPADLGEGVAGAGEGHDDVVVDLGEGGAVAAEADGAGAIGFLDHVVGAGGFIGEPREEGGAEVEAHAGVVIDDADDLVFRIGDARGAIGGVTLCGDAVVPVMVWGGGVLDFDGLEPGILPGRLIEVAVDAHEAVGGGGLLAGAG